MKDLHQIFAKSTMIQLNKVCEKVKDTPYNVIKAWLLDNDNDNVIASRLGISLNTTKRL